MFLSCSFSCSFRALNLREHAKVKVSFPCLLISDLTSHLKQDLKLPSSLLHMFEVPMLKTQKTVFTQGSWGSLPSHVKKLTKYLRFVDANILFFNFNTLPLITSCYSHKPLCKKAFIVSLRLGNRATDGFTGVPRLLVRKGGDQGWHPAVTNLLQEFG